MSNKSLEFSIKYSTLDYLHISNYCYNHVLEVLKEKNKSFDYWLSRLIKPFALIFITFVNKMGKLRYRYDFVLGDTFVRTSQGHSSELEWLRFSSYAESSKAIFLQLDKNIGKDGQVVILKRVLRENEMVKLIDVFSKNNINKAKLDLNIDI